MYVQLTLRVGGVFFYTDVCICLYIILFVSALSEVFDI